MQGCGGRRRIAWWASCCFLEYGVQCLPLTPPKRKDRADVMPGHAQRVRSLTIRENGHSWRNGRTWQIAAAYFERNRAVLNV
jgi:hypothetical protein